MVIIGLLDVLNEILIQISCCAHSVTQFNLSFLFCEVLMIECWCSRVDVLFGLFSTFFFSWAALF